MPRHHGILAERTSLLEQRERGVAARQRRCLVPVVELHVERACGRVKGALDLALVRIAPYLGLDLLPGPHRGPVGAVASMLARLARAHQVEALGDDQMPLAGDRKSTRLNSSHTVISYAVFCLKKKKQTNNAVYIVNVEYHGLLHTR